MVTCEECGQNFKTKQALSSHKRVHDDVAVGAKLSLATQEKNTDNMLDFFGLMEQGESPMAACLSLQVNPAYADKWARIYSRLAMKGEKGKDVYQILEATLKRLETLQTYVVNHVRSSRQTEEMLCELMVDTSYDIADTAINNHIKRYHSGFFQ